MIKGIDFIAVAIGSCFSIGLLFSLMNREFKKNDRKLEEIDQRIASINQSIEYSLDCIRANTILPRPIRTNRALLNNDVNLSKEKQPHLEILKH